MIIGAIILFIIAISPILYRQNQRIRVLEEQVRALDERNKPYY
ncbi:hypothetical protein [Paenibacillus sp. Z6-24]